MERLTEYDEFGNAEFVGIDNTKLYERLVCDETVALTIATNKLAKLEDVMERWHIENLEGYISALIEVRNIAIEEKKTQFKRYIEEVTKREKLEQELAELKQNAIVPKFKIGQEVWVNDWTGQLRIGRIYEVQTNAVLHSQQPLITYLVDFYGNYEDDDQENDYYEEKDVFATKEEAEKKLAEIKGDKDE